MKRKRKIFGKSTNNGKVGEPEVCWIVDVGSTDVVGRPAREFQRAVDSDGVCIQAVCRVITV